MKDRWTINIWKNINLFYSIKLITPKSICVHIETHVYTHKCPCTGICLHALFIFSFISLFLILCLCFLPSCLLYLFSITFFSLFIVVSHVYFPKLFVLLLLYTYIWSAISKICSFLLLKMHTHSDKHNTVDCNL